MSAIILFVTIAPGDIISDRYRVVDKLGEGGMGAVFRAEHVHMRKMVALKVLLAELARHEEIVARFEREAVAAANIEHPNVAAATDFGRLPDGAFFLVMEFVPGRSLRAELANGALAPPRALEITRGILGAIEAAHAKNIIHRDLKPENVMLVERDGNPDFVKVLDFGIAKVDVMTGDQNKPGLTRTGTVMGTPEYMAPEQAVGQAVDARSDFYSLGIILYEMLTGKPPFHGEPIVVMGKQVTATPPPLPDDVTNAVPGIAPVMDKLLAKEPQNRYADAKELRMALAPMLATSMSAVPVAPIAPVAPSSSRISIEVPQGGFETNPEAKTMLPIEEPAAVKRAPLSRMQLVIAGGGLLLVVGIVSVALAVSSTSGANAATLGSASAAPSTIPSASVATIALPPPSTSASSDPDADDAPTASAPRPKPGTATAPKKTTTQKKEPRKTGPGGIYIPPPDTWFK